jgi:hypothetical protein
MVDDVLNSLNEFVKESLKLNELPPLLKSLKTKAAEHVSVEWEEMDLENFKPEDDGEIEEEEIRKFFLNDSATMTKILEYKNMTKHFETNQETNDKVLIVHDLASAEIAWEKMFKRNATSATNFLESLSAEDLQHLDAADKDSFIVTGDIQWLFQLGRMKREQEEQASGKVNSENSN